MGALASLVHDILESACIAVCMKGTAMHELVEMLLLKCCMLWSAA